MSIGGEHASEAAEMLRAAASISDPYLRADTIWEAVQRVRAPAGCQCGRDAAAHHDITRRLEEGCEGATEPPVGDPLRGYARALDAIYVRAGHAGSGRKPNRALQLDQPRWRDTMREPEALAHEATHIAILQVEAEEGSERAQREVDERRADLNADALRAIQAVLDGQDWTPDSPESIAGILRAIGLPVRDVEESMQADAEH